ncbi:MAG: hypothetical protein ABI551_13125 [Polyangiaceae bacterium]
MSKYHNDASAADMPGRLSLSESRLRLLQPELFGWRSLFVAVPWFGRVLDAAQMRTMVGEHLQMGDANPALVVTTSPVVIIAAYTDELDALVLLRFDPIWAQLLHLVPNLRLLTINTYIRGTRVSPDIQEGARAMRRYANVYPLIAETLSDDQRAIQERKTTLDAELWNRAQELLTQRVSDDRVCVRDGTPLRSRGPGAMLSLSSG